MEILAPAGNMEALKAAVACGADAVYLGAKDFNARNKAENFSDEQLRLAVSYCHERGVRVYVTMNTVVKSTEIAAAVSVAERAVAAGADAFLVQDLGLFRELSRRFPDTPFHASTQMGVHNVYGAIFAEKIGFDRVVLSRETLAEDVRQIKEHTGVEIELFVHGAHCVSFSGNCYFSSLVSGYSGNRGKCLQLCRKKYRLSDGKKFREGYMLSAKDICLVNKVGRLERLGVDSLKIEGRLRSPEYAGVVSEVYRRAANGGSVGAADIDRLKSVFNRGDFSEAYLENDRAELIFDRQQNNIGVKVAEVSAVSGKKLIVGGKYRGQTGDGYKILRHGREVGSAFASDRAILYEGHPQKGDELRLTKSAETICRMQERIAADQPIETEECAKIIRINHGIMSDIVSIPYYLPLDCVLLQADEETPEKFFGYADIVIFSPKEYDLAVVRRMRRICKKPMLLEMPVEARGGDVRRLKEIVDADPADGYVANNVYALELCKDHPILLGAGMNSVSSAPDVPKIMSYEAADIENNAVLYAFGRIPLMQLTHCPKKQLGYHCGNCESCGSLTLTDERSNRFYFRRRKEYYCYFELLNGKILNLLPKLDAEKHRRILIDVRDIETKSALAALVHPRKTVFDSRVHTYGRFGKGVK